MNPLIIAALCGVTTSAPGDPSFDIGVTNTDSQLITNNNDTPLVISFGAFAMGPGSTGTIAWNTGAFPYTIPPRSSLTLTVGYTGSRIGDIGTATGTYQVIDGVSGALTATAEKSA